MYQFRPISEAGTDLNSIQFLNNQALQAEKDIGLPLCSNNLLQIAA